MKLLRRLSTLSNFFYHQRVKGFEVADEPFLDEVAAQWFTERLGRAQSYIEFGSGGSTRLAARLNVPTVSGECDRFFARAVRDGLAQPNQIDLVDVDIGFTYIWGIPFFGKPTDERVKKWRRYIDLPMARQIDHMKRSGRPFPDLALVDGRFRIACALRFAYEAAQRSVEADLLFDDYYSEEHRRYSAVEAILGAPTKIGRAALFRITPAAKVETSQIDAAIRDYR